MRKMNERVQLHEKILELQVELAAIKNTNLLRSKQLRFGTESSGWRGIALRQYQRRVEAEALNRDLRLHLQQCHDASQDLIRSCQLKFGALKKTSTLESLMRNEASKRKMEFTDRDMAIVHKFSGEIRAEYSQADGIFANWSPNTSPDSPYRREQQWQRNQKQNYEYFELMEEWMVPFSFDTAILALFQSVPIQMSVACIPGVLRIPTNEQDILAVKYAFSLLDTSGHPTWYEAAFVIMVFRESSRALFSWRAAFNQLDIPGIQYSEKGYGAANPQHNSSLYTAPWTKFTFCTQYDSRCSLSETEKSKLLKKFAKQLNRTIRQDTADWHATVETTAVQLLSGLSLGAVK